MGFCEIKGQEKAVEQLKTGLRTGRIAHSYIFYGPGGVGKNKAAVIFAQGLNCTKKKDVEPCGECPSCHKITSGNHPDVTKIVPEGASIKITQIRSMQEKAFYKSYEGMYKVIIIDDADKLTIEAANSLLKILEDPPERTLFILLAEEMSKLPVTVISRCQSILFGPLDVDIIHTILEEQGIEGNFPLGLAQGSARKAIQIQKNTGTQKIFADVEMILQDLRRGNYKKILNWAELLEKNRDQLEIILEIMSLYYRDRIISLLVDDSHVLLDTLPLKDYRIEECYDALEKLDNAFQRLRNNANTRLVLEVLLIDLKNIEQIS
ncbi:MAG: DNA polymerase III subunit delta' [Firmicutes bacterium HGW-Firmicutes-12]|jgi:DNA polymerase-3 subunit delta'|nr:MAG: DNA polymerase III subunit delta' [Firmicutes bacterium HGW-Firmicutes-12]